MGAKFQLSIGLLAFAWLAAGVPNAWTADCKWACPSGFTGDWFVATNWVSSLAPTNAGDTATITNGYVLLTNSAALLASFSISNATLIFSNWNTMLNATNVSIHNSGFLSLPGAFATNQMSNNIYIVCSNFTLNAGGTVLADAKGYAGQNGPGRGADKAYGSASGGGYGGNGGGAASGQAGGIAYGSTQAPFDPGSGGGREIGDGHAGGAGGGAVRIEATGTVIIDGVVSANGGNGAVDLVGNRRDGGAGSGGAIYISCRSFGGGTNGILQANGGSVMTKLATVDLGGGAGGGGRIVVNYSGLSGTPAVRVSANCGVGWQTVSANMPNDWTAPQVGTLGFTNADLLDNVLAAWTGLGAGLNGYVCLQSTNTWSPVNLQVLSNSTLGVSAGCFWNITNDLKITATGGVVVAEHATLVCGGNLTLTNGASLVVYGGETNLSFTNSYGAMVDVASTLAIGSGCWIYPFSHSTNGGSVLLRVGSLALLSGGGINANGRGYARTNGPGKGADAPWSSAGGGGYGGKGGTGGAAGGDPYGSANVPSDPGSGGGNGTGDGILGGHGGGVVRIEAADNVTVNGMASANGNDGGTISGHYSGAGAGGSIYISCGSFGGAGGQLSANGGARVSGAGGGGGRIAVWSGVPINVRNRYLLNSNDCRAITRSTSWPQFAAISVTNGAGNNNGTTNGAFSGTCFFFKYIKGTQLGIR